MVYEIEGSISSYVGLDLTDNKRNAVFYLRAVYVPKRCWAVLWKHLQPPLKTTPFYRLSNVLPHMHVHYLVKASHF